MGEAELNMALSKSSETPIATVEARITTLTESITFYKSTIDELGADHCGKIPQKLAKDEKQLQVEEKKLAELKAEEAAAEGGASPEVEKTVEEKARDEVSQALKEAK